MTRQNKIDIILLLSALESWGFAEKRCPPDFISARMCEAIKPLSEEVLKEDKDE